MADPLTIAAGVWAWESYGKDAVAWLVKRLGRNLEDLKKDGWEKIDWRRASQRYREEMQRLYGSMQIWKMNRPMLLSDVYTDVYLLDKPTALRRHSIDELQKRSELHATASDSDERHAGAALIEREPRLYILGQPGAGKTTFLKHLVIESVQMQGRINAIPIFASLKDWSDSNLDLMSFLVRQFAICNFPNAQPFVETILEEGKAMVLFDGLDEVSEAQAQRQRITQAVRDFARQYGKSRVIITCRTAAIEYTFEGFTYCELAEFTQEQIKAFVSLWFQHSETKRKAFLEAFARPENLRLGELARRPLLLTLLCLTFDETMSFPQRRAELYEEAIDALLKKWDGSRSIQRGQVYQKLSLGYKRQLLAALAVESFERSEFFMPKQDLANRVVRFMRRLPSVEQSEDIDGDAILRAIEAQHGLLIERAHNIYSFSHLTFHEYFTATYIIRHANERVLKETVAHGADLQWREVLLLTASMLDYENAQLFFQTWVHHLQNAINKVDLAALIAWCTQQTQVNTPSSSSLRAAALMVACIDQAALSTTSIVESLRRVSTLA